jgi:hypothetical protein
MTHPVLQLLARRGAVPPLDRQGPWLLGHQVLPDLELFLDDDLLILQCLESEVEPSTRFFGLLAPAPGPARKAARVLSSDATRILLRAAVSTAGADDSKLDRDLTAGISALCRAWTGGPEQDEAAVELGELPASADAAIESWRRALAESGWPLSERDGGPQFRVRSGETLTAGLSCDGGTGYVTVPLTTRRPLRLIAREAVARYLLLGAGQMPPVRAVRWAAPGREAIGFGVVLPPPDDAGWETSLQRLGAAVAHFTDTARALTESDTARHYLAFAGMEIPHESLG